jgi:AraC-like DNA-binding protein
MIGKTRQDEANTRGWLASEVGAPRGILNPPPPTPEEFRLSRRKPAADLARFIEHYWIVAWDLRHRAPHTQETLPQPNVHVVFEKNNSHAFGVVTGKFSRYLEGKSHVFGIKFAPGMFRPFFGDAVSQLTNRTRPVREIFGDEVTALEEILTSQSPDDNLVAAANSFFQAHIPEADDKADLARELVRQALEQRDLLTVDDLARRSAIGKRSLQRLFSEYVGVSPKWVIRRYRLHEAIDRLRDGERLDYAQLALELGYFDQAHLINDFKSILGYTPTEFQKMR